MGTVDLAADQAEWAWPCSTCCSTCRVSPTVARTWTCGRCSRNSEQFGQEVLARDRAGGQRQLARQGGLAARQFLDGLAVQGEDALRVVVETMAGLGQQDVAALAVEERHAEELFQRLDALADGSWVKPRALPAAVKLARSAAWRTSPGAATVRRSWDGLPRDGKK